MEFSLNFWCFTQWPHLATKLFFWAATGKTLCFQRLTEGDLLCLTCTPLEDY